MLKLWINSTKKQNKTKHKLKDFKAKSVKTILSCVLPVPKTFLLIFSTVFGEGVLLLSLK